jgi:energy-coupling factor transport system substrate-specific component
MIVLVALCAALYTVAITLTTVPTSVGRSIRVIAQLLPMPLSLLFGPAAAWGVALGDLISNIMVGNLYLGTLSGFSGNFLLGFLPYAMWTRLRPLANGNREIALGSVRQWILYILIAAVSAFSAAVVISWPVHMVGVVPFSVFVNIIGIEDAIAGAFAGILLLLLYSRIKARGLVYWDVMEEVDLDNTKRTRGHIGAWLVSVAAITSWAIGGIILPDSADIVGGIGTVIILIGALLMW